MPSFRYRALSPGGKLAVGSIEGSDTNDAVRLLSGRGLTVTWIALQKSGNRQRSTSRLRLRPDDVVALLREWATLLSAGLTLDDALSICATDGKAPKVLAALKALRRSVRDGRALHVALQEIGILPREAIILIEAGETAGSLPVVLERLADDFSQKRATQDGLVTALLYPAVLLITTFAAVAMIVLVVAPNLAELFESSTGKPPARIAALLAFSEFVRYATPVFFAASLSLVLAMIAVSRRERWRLNRDAVLLRIPFFGGILRSQDSSRFALAGALMIQCGVVPTRALPLAASAMSNNYLRVAVAGALASAAHGVPLQEALAKARALPADLLALIDAGVRTGRLGEVLHHGGALHAARAASRIQRFGALLTPAITVFAGVVVGTLAYLVLSAVVSLNEVAFQ